MKRKSMSVGRRLAYGVVGGALAICLLFLTVTVQAQGTDQQSNIDPNECGTCHEAVVAHWSESEHATEELLYNSLTHGPMTSQATVATEMGGATCDSCHWLGEFSPSHPEMIMQTDMSANLCGTCHEGTAAEWENSTHGDEDIACVRCHDPHSTSIKADSVQSLCFRCHTEEAHFYKNSSHAMENLLCTDCHLGKVENGGGPLGDGDPLANKLHHSFDVGLETCNQCHLDTMHYPAIETVSIISGTANSISEPPSPQVIPSNLSLEPGTVSPLSVVMVLMAGVVMGLFLAPQIEGRLRRGYKSREWVK